MALTVNEAQAALNEAEAKMAAATTTSARIAASKEALAARRELQAANAAARAEAATAREEAAAAARAKAEAERPKTGQEMAALLKGVRPIIGPGESPDVIGGAGFPGYVDYKPLDEAGRRAIFGINPATGKAYTDAESAAANAGYNPYAGAVGYEIDPRTGSINVLTSQGTVMTTGARYETTSAGYIVPQASSRPPGVGFDAEGKMYEPGQRMPGESTAAYIQRLSALGGGVLFENGKTYQYDASGKFFIEGEQPQPEGFGLTTSATADRVSGTGTTQSPLVINGIPYTGTYNNRSYNNGVLAGTTDAGGQKFDGSGTTNSPLTVNGRPYNGVLGGVTYTNGIAKASFTESDVETKARRSAQQDFKSALTELGLGDLVDTVDEMIKQDFTVANIKLELPKTAAYINRFPGMAPLRAAGRAISEAQYIANERGYLQTLRAYGLDTNVLGSRGELGKYIQNEVSPREFEERVNLAATRVRENPDVLNAFKSFYPEVDASGVVAYLLNPKQGLDIIKKQVKTVEIGSAAQAAGFAKELVGIAEAGSLMTAVGETNYAGLVNEFRQARQLAMNQRRLASIEGQQYTDLEAIGAVVGDNLEQGLASQRRASREVARFGGSGGISGASLRSTVAI